MGEVIIKVPEDVREVIDLGISYKEVKKKIRELEREKKGKKREVLIKKFFSLSSKLNEKIKKKSVEETKGDFYEGVVENNG
jgi:microcompartment protein CcmL/EutN